MEITDFIHQKSLVLVSWVSGTQKNPKNVKNINTSTPESFMPET